MGILGLSVRGARQSHEVRLIGARSAYHTSWPNWSAIWLAISMAKRVHPSTRADLVAQLQRLSPDERSELMDAAAAENSRDAGMQAAAQGLADLVGHHQPKEGPTNA